MKVFLSSVTHALRAERDGLAAQLSVMPPYVPRRFEDFTAQNRSSREACLAGVEDCDVYVLLLGPRYGDPLPDTNKAATEEEFEYARRLGKPILVFLKEIDEADEPRQADFKTRVQGYVGGYFRASFTDTLSLNIAVTAALAEVALTPTALQWTTLPEPAGVTWRWEVPAVRDSGLYGPVLDAHLVPISGSPLRATQLQELPRQLARTGRDAGFLAEVDAVETASDASLAWSWVRNQSSGGVAFTERQDHAYRGLLAYRSGQVTVFEALPTDSMGALVDRTELQGRLSRLFVLAEQCLSPDVASVAVAAALAPLDRVFEGDPAKVGGRMSGTMHMMSGAGAAVPAVSAVPRTAIAGHAGDVAAEMAVELLTQLRTVH